MRSPARADISRDEVKARGWIVVNDEVFDINPFLRAHPGGRFLERLQGTDATYAFNAAHEKNPVAKKVLSLFRVGTLDRKSSVSIDEDFASLHASFRDRGLFVEGKARLVAGIARIVLAFLAGAWLAETHPIAAFLLFTVASIDLTWWVHDVGHDSVFSTESGAKRALEVMGIVFLGTPQAGYHYRAHRMHHAFPNVMGVDRALETGPVVWHEAMLARTRPGWLRWQAIVWLALVLPFTFLFLTRTTVTYCLEKRSYGLLALLVVRWALVISLFSPVLALLPVLIAGFVLGFFASLNHFHLPISDAPDESFVHTVLNRTQNLTGLGVVTGWLSGGLDYHIEHHLFPTMPRRHYARIAPEIRRFCELHRLPYRSCTLGEAALQLFRKLRSPL